MGESGVGGGGYSAAEFMIKRYIQSTLKASELIDRLTLFTRFFIENEQEIYTEEHKAKSGQLQRDINTSMDMTEHVRQMMITTVEMTTDITKIEERDNPIGLLLEEGFASSETMRKKAEILQSNRYILSDRFRKRKAKQLEKKIQTSSARVILYLFGMMGFALFLAFYLH